MADSGAGGRFGPIDSLLLDGSTVAIRCATGEDRAAVTAFHEGLSLEDSSRRYFGARPHLDDGDLARITAGEPDDLALLAERDGRVVAVAEYHRAKGSSDADVGFVVAEAFQGRGIGTLLLEHLASFARLHGVQRFVADTLADNSPMLAVFSSAGFAATSRLDSGVVTVVLDIAASPEAIAAAERRDNQAVVASMARLLRPRSIAVIGASRQRGAVGHELVRNLVAGGFVGPVYPINPSAASIASLPAWSSVTEVSGDVDLAIIAVPAPRVAEVVASCAAKGVGGLVVVSSGFTESGPAGAVLQGELVKVAHEGGMRLVGPNCFGVIETDPQVSMNATFAADSPLRGRVGFASQSGGLGIAILAEARQRGLGLSSFVSMGNKADVSGNDCLAWWEQDDATAVILLYLESFGNPRRFSRLARRIGRTKPIVAVKGGRTVVGAAAAASHTAALASSEQAVEALFRESGVLRVDTVEELFDVSELLVHQPLPPGPRVGIVTNAGGPGVLAADACIRWGLVVPELSASLVASLGSLAPGAGSLRNPIDLGSGASPTIYREVLGALLESRWVDCVLVIFTPPISTRAEDVALAIVAACDATVRRGTEHGAGIPVVASFLGTGSSRGSLAGGMRPIPCFTYPETAVRAIADTVRYERWRSSPLPAGSDLEDIDVNAARRSLPTARGDEQSTWITGAKALGVLHSIGIPTLAGADVTDVDSAVEAARSIGFPVALKVAGPEILHKSDVGGIHLGLNDAASVRTAYAALQTDVGPAMTGATVEEMASPGVEMIVGFVQDPQFGPVVLVGLGGTAVELLGDHQVALAPLGRAGARELILGLRAAPLLTGFRNSAPVDVEALVDVVVRMAQMAEHLPEIGEADCNPVVVMASGAVVVDARLRLAVPRAPRDDRRRLR
jgi:acetyl coenzyme A synthetase (ADP forming)-like protein